MPIKDKFIGLILIAVGALPLLLRIENINTFFSRFSFLSFLVPGQIIYQLLIIIIGILLVWKFLEE